MISRMTPAARERLAKHVLDRRRTLGMSIREAAAAARMNRLTWASMEKAERDIRDSKYADVERTLSWSPGSVETVLDGGEPTPLAEDTPSPQTRPDVEELSKIIQEILDIDELSQEDRWYFIERARADWEAEQEAARQRTRDRTVTRIEEWRRLRGA